MEQLLETKKGKTIFVIAITALLIAITLLVWVIVRPTHEKEPEHEVNTVMMNALHGTWDFSDTVRYTFEKTGRGFMYSAGTTYEFSFTAYDDQLVLTFVSQYAQQSHYTVLMQADTLMLIGGEGTSPQGQEYTLTRVSKKIIGAPWNTKADGGAAAE